MSDYTVELEGTDELLRNLNRISGDLRGKVAKEAVNAGALMIKDKAVQNAPVKTGNLRNSAIVESSATGNGAEAVVRFRMVYSRIQEFGGTITARNKPYLVYQVKGHWRKSKSVKITGKHYLSRAINSEKGLAVKAMSDVVSAYLGK